MKFPGVATILCLLLLGGCSSTPSTDSARGPLIQPPATKTFPIPVFDAGQKPALIDLPPHYVREVANGADFDVIYFRANAIEGIALYIGKNPHLASSEPGVQGVVRQPGIVGGTTTDWLEWNKDGVAHAEALLRNFYRQPPSEEPPPQVLVSIFAPTDAARNKLEAAAATLRLGTATGL